MKDYSELIQSVIAGVGGAENIENCIHCATRLGFGITAFLLKSGKVKEYN